MGASADVCAAALRAGETELERAVAGKAEAEPGGRALAEFADEFVQIGRGRVGVHQRAVGLDARQLVSPGIELETISGHRAQHQRQRCGQLAEKDRGARGRRQQERVDGFAVALAIGLPFISTLVKAVDMPRSVTARASLAL